VTLTIDSKKCNGCGNCVSECPAFIFSIDDNHKAKPEAMENCINCFHCVSICPRGAITHSECSPSDLIKLPERSVTPAQIKNLIFSRRSIRNFKDREIPDKVIEELLDVASQTETGSNLQSESFLILHNREKMKELEILMGEILWNKAFKFTSGKGLLSLFLSRKTNPVIWKSLLRYNRVFAAQRANGKISGTLLWNAPVIIVIHGIADNNLGPQNAALAIRDIELVAQSMGLATCWSGFLVAAARLSGKINDFLGLAKTRKIYGALILGYPVFFYKHRLPRKKRDVSYL
jgi:nitroreductase/NAD-dependent dihydropyrimidine dehydrogenase PreA subunit